MQLDKETRTAYLAMAGCILGACAIRYVSHTIVAATATEPIAFALRSLFIFVWVSLLRRRFVRRETMLLLCAFALLIFAWWFLQLFKYDFSEHMPNVGRWLWYLYYVPTLFAPPMLLLAASYVGMPENWRPHRFWPLLFVVSGALCLAVLTNDMHQLVFDYGGVVADGIRDPVYSKGPLYYIVWGWSAALIVLALITLLRRCARSGLLVRALVPTAIFAVMLVTLTFYPPYHRTFLWTFVSTTDLACFGIVAYVESLLATGIFPSNSGYDTLWAASSLGGGFLDGEGCFIDLSANAPAVQEAQVLEALEHPVALDGGRLELVARPVTGGTVFWVRDKDAVHRLSQELEDLGDALVHERSMLQSEIEVAHEREALAQRQELYASVDARTSAQLSALEGTLDNMPEDDDAFLAEMLLASVYAVYIKRCANLTFLGEGGNIEVRELSLAFEESCACLRSIGADASVALEAAGKVSSADALDAYAQFERLVEETLPDLSSVCVGGSSSQGLLDLSVSVCGATGRCELSLSLALIGGAS